MASESSRHLYRRTSGEGGLLEGAYVDSGAMGDRHKNKVKQLPCINISECSL